MLQLKHIKLLCDLTGEIPSEIKAVKFGLTPTYATALTIGLAFQEIPPNRVMIVLRTQSYMFNNDNTAADFCLYRTLPSAQTYWALLDPVTSTIIQKNYTNVSAARQLTTDVDEFLFFPPGYTAGLYFKPNQLPPATGTYMISTTVYGYLVSPKISDKLQGSQAWISKV